VRLQGKVAIVTGAGSGIGRATAALFAAEGAQVIAADLEAPADAQNIVGVAADAGRDEDVAALVRSAEARFGGLDIVFANAGVSGGLASLFEQSAEDWAEVLRVNLIGPFWRSSMPRRSSRRAAAGRSSYRVRRGPALGRGRPGLYRVQARRHRPRQSRRAAAQRLDVRVNAICPGLIETGMTEFIYERARARGQEGALGHLNPMKRGGAPDEIARAALYLASAESSYVNGHALVVDGGLSSSHPFNRQDYGRTAI
jgi:NAD(P)-dependent dehydrogenase (short-subunit alcohol dehydrogenase family)